MSFTIDLIGFDTIQERLKTASEEVFKQVDAEIGASAQNMELGAKRDAPKDRGTLVQEISHFQEQPLKWALVSRALHSAFVEFGTRDNRVVPAGLEQEAAVINASSSIGAKAAIFAWCARNGIERKAWYPIFIKIMTKGINPHPFFFKQLDSERSQLLSRLQQIL